jgi:hypothetical protein
MGRRSRREERHFRRAGAGGRTGIDLTDSADYWPLTLMPTATRARRPISTWMFISALLALGAGLLLAIQPGIPTW